VLDPRTLGGTGFHARRVAEARLAAPRAPFEHIHAGRLGPASRVAALGDGLLDAVIAHFGRLPRPRIGRAGPRGYTRIVARARAYIVGNLEQPLPIDAIAAAAYTSRRTLYRAFTDVLDETPQSYVRKLRLHRIRRQLASDAEVLCTITMVANQWGMSELGRLSGWYRDLFGELPSETLAQSRRLLDLAA